MVLTINYSDLQNIKKQMIKNKITDDEKIYLLIDSYKSTLNHMYKNNLVQNKTKIEYEYELLDFANNMLKNTNKTYKELEHEYMRKNTSNLIINPNEIKLRL